MLLEHYDNVVITYNDIATYRKLSMIMFLECYQLAKTKIVSFDQDQEHYIMSWWSANTINFC